MLYLFVYLISYVFNNNTFIRPDMNKTSVPKKGMEFMEDGGNCRKCLVELQGPQCNSEGGVFVSSFTGKRSMLAYLLKTLKSTVVNDAFCV